MTSSSPMPPTPPSSKAAARALTHIAPADTPSLTPAACRLEREMGIALTYSELRRRQPLDIKIPVRSGRVGMQRDDACVVWEE